MTAQSTEDTSKPWRLASILVAAAIFVLLGITCRDYGLTTDEPIYILNTKRLIAWVDDLFQQGPTTAFEQQRVREGVYFARPDSKNLPVVSIVAALGYATLGHFDSPPAAYRWGNIFVFAVTCGILFHWLSRQFSFTAAIVGVAALIGTPRLFAHAQLLNIDTLVGCFWMLASWALFQSRNHWRMALLFGILCGIGMMTKPTFWFALPVWIIWGLLFRPRELWHAAVCLATVTPLTALCLMPPWWSSPVGGFLQYIDMLRHDKNGWQIDAYYLGEVYQMTGLPPVPWHSVFVLSAVTTPLWISLLAIVGVAHWLRRDRTAELIALWVGSGIILPLIVMLPVTPAHDGVRLYRASFFFLALLAGYGFHTLSTKWLSGHHDRRFFRSKPEAIMVAAILLGAAWPLWRMHPGQLSYYNLITGGLDGAAQPQEYKATLRKTHRPRFEIAYWWAAMNEDAWTEMQNQLPPGAKLWVFPEHFGLDRLKEWGHLRKDIQVVGPGESQFLLIYGRLGRLMDPRSGRLGDQFLFGDPLWEKRINNTRVAALFRR